MTRMQHAMEDVVLFTVFAVGTIGMLTIGYDMGQKAAPTNAQEAPCVEPPNPPHQGGVVMTFCP